MSRRAPRFRLQPATPITILFVALLLGLASGRTPLGTLAQATPVTDGTPAAAGTPAAGGSVVFELPGDAVYPEGVAYDPGTGLFYVSGTADGTIFQGDIETGEVEVFLEGGADGRTTAVGLKVDEDGLLYVAGGSTGLVSIYDTETGTLVGQADNGLAPNTFVNDLAVSDDVAYATDSFNPFVDAVTLDEDGAAIATFVDFTGTAFELQEDGFNGNGIVATDDGQHLLVVQSATGLLFRIEIATGGVTQVDLGGADLTFGDGMALDGQTLYVVRNQEEVIAQVELGADFATGELVQEFGDPTFNYPTTLALTGDGRALVVNSQFDAQESGDPELPFTVSLITPPGTEAGATPVVEATTPAAAPASPTAAAATVAPGAAATAPPTVAATAPPVAAPTAPPVAEPTTTPVASPAP